MTTTVTIKTRAWPCRVTLTEKTEGEQGHDINEASVRVSRNSEKSFQVESASDLTVHEIQPNESDFEQGDDTATEEAAEEPAKTQEKVEDKKTEEKPTESDKPKGKSGKTKTGD